MTDVLVWSRDGCKTLPGNVQGTLRCECTHLTNFALLLDDDQSETTKKLRSLNEVGELLLSSFFVKRKKKAVETEHKLNLCETFRRLSGHLVTVLCTFNLHYMTSSKWTKITFDQKMD